MNRSRPNTSAPQTNMTVSWTTPTIEKKIQLPTSSVPMSDVRGQQPLERAAFLFLEQDRGRAGHGEQQEHHADAGGVVGDDRRTLARRRPRRLASRSPPRPGPGRRTREPAALSPPPESVAGRSSSELLEAGDRGSAARESARRRRSRTARCRCRAGRRAPRSSPRPGSGRRRCAGRADSMDRESARSAVVSPPKLPKALAESRRNDDRRRFAFRAYGQQRRVAIERLRIAALPRSAAGPRRPREHPGRRGPRSDLALTWSGRGRPR